jgi:hypothetical protein
VHEACPAERDNVPEKRCLWNRAERASRLIRLKMVTNVLRREWPEALCRGWQMASLESEQASKRTWR